MVTRFDRRAFIGLGAASLGAAIGDPRAADAGQQRRLAPAPERPFTAPPIDVVRIGFVGVGLQGSSHCRNLLRIEGVRLAAVCDIVEDKVTRVQGWVEEAGQPRPRGYVRGERDFERMCQEEEIDLVFTATPWRWHVPVCVAAMTNGKHAATEVPAAVTIDDCW